MTSSESDSIQRRKESPESVLAGEYSQPAIRGDCNKEGKPEGERIMLSLSHCTRVPLLHCKQVRKC
jgi:hypothetical protein